MIAPLLDTHIWIWYVADTLEKCEMRISDCGIGDCGSRKSLKLTRVDWGIADWPSGNFAIRNPHFAIPQFRIS